jgi:hypothetical protein
MIHLGTDIPDELDICHALAATAEGCDNLVPKWSGTPEDPAVV